MTAAVRIKSLLEEVLVYWVNKDHGWDWILKLEEIEEHIEMCPINNSEENKRQELH